MSGEQARMQSKIAQESRLYGRASSPITTLSSLSLYRRRSQHASRPSACIYPGTNSGPYDLPDVSPCSEIFTRLVDAHTSPTTTLSLFALVPHGHSIRRVLGPKQFERRPDIYRGSERQ
ncbi:hypothetical protein NEOLEDRAFT_1138845 [Neolentinus lepideus HHB14362 ss-1]|uniref:Uncharacterized protein n=1 Tax=Neolentinus lepideus HHB14362 ss-1 TaxID=1314782 RepID=A0A165Q2Y5_9AGAM|nr:hypothetical protein NEOLEDRAFT_1138845 [Neolentinus lepideus HHB14362 ss-1]